MSAADRMRCTVAAALLLCGCGAPAPGASLSFALSGELAAQTRQLQVVFVRRGAGLGVSLLDCTSVRAACVRDVLGSRLPEPLLGPDGHEGRPALVVPLDAAATPRLQPQVAAGTYLVAVEAVDAAGKLAGGACELNVALEAGTTTPLRLMLERTPADCSPLFP